MITLPVNTSKKYNVMIGRDILMDTGRYLADVCSVSKAAIISDTNVWPLYGQSVSQSLTDAGFEVCHHVFPAGEESKNANTYISILNFLAKNTLTRTDCIIALGGGVVGDITGFSAATYLRGISYIQIPTTLLAMVDSSVGGKTAIDLDSGKNLAGAFYQPDLVLCDITSLSTLPEETFRDGCAEVIKYGILYDCDLFSHLEKNGLSFDQEKVIAQCITHKKNVVCEDEYDTGARQKLNLGHTIGHSIEALSQYSISHGQAVSIGTDIITKASLTLGICDQATYDRIHSVLQKFCLPTFIHFSPADLFHYAQSDKKRISGSVNLIVPQQIGNCLIRPTPISDLQSIIEAGM